MTGELATFRPGPRTAIAGWVDDFTELATAAAQLAQTNFIPQSLRVYRSPGNRDYDAAATAAQVVAAILTGEELGLSKMASLRSIDVIQGTPALRAIALRAIVQAAGHELWVEEATNNRAIVAGKRAGSEHTQRIQWTMDDARSRGLTNKPNWRSQPRNMLLARATGDVARLIAADSLLGLPYTAEELEDGDTNVPQPLDDAPAAAAGPRKARRAQPAIDGVKVARQVRKVMESKATRVEDEPAPDEPAADSDKPANKVPADVTSADEPALDDGGGPPPVTPAQLRKLHAALSEQDILDRNDRLAYVQDIIGREIASSSELTAAEASAVIDELQSLDLPTSEAPLDADE